jgi:hypothetical protein
MSENRLMALLFNVVRRRFPSTPVQNLKDRGPGS